MAGKSHLLTITASVSEGLKAIATRAGKATPDATRLQQTAALLADALGVNRSFLAK